MLTDASRLACLTADLPGVGGVLREEPEDFLVEEQSKTRPSGEGEHLMLFVQKRSLTTMELARRTAKAFRVSSRAVGYAGLKDKHAVTRQHLTVQAPGADTAALAAGVERLNSSDRVEVIWAEPHHRKLKRGHHGGNRFILTIRQVQPTKIVAAKAVLERLESRGVPNFVGDQRFGFRNNSHLLGRLMLRGDYAGFLEEMLYRDDPADSKPLREARPLLREGKHEEALAIWPKALRFDRQMIDRLRQGMSPEQAVRRLDSAQRKIMVSALQSSVFNRVLEMRLADGSFDRLLPGDLAWKHDSRAVFRVDAEQAEADNAPGGRVAMQEVSPSGPLWGTDMMRCEGRPLEIETSALDEAELQPEDFAGPEGMRDVAVEGQRRPLRVRLESPSLSAGSDDRGPYIRVSFGLTRGAYATTVMREVMKTEPTG